MDIAFEAAVRTLVCVAIGQDPGKRVTVGLIVAVLARKFAPVPEEHIARIVAQTALEEGGTVDFSIPATRPMAYRRSA